MHYFKPGLNKLTMNTNTRNICLKQHRLGGLDSLLGQVAAVYPTSARNTFNSMIEWGMRG
jgi:hypothetical protein